MVTPSNPFAAWLDRAAGEHRAAGTPEGDWLAGKIEALARGARYFEAVTPGELERREAEHDAWLALDQVAASSGVQS